MNWLIDTAAKFSGLSWVWEKMDGYKTKTAGVVSILSGMAGLIQEIINAESQHSFAAFLELAKGLPQDQSWLLIVGGLAVLGIGHKHEKAEFKP